MVRMLTDYTRYYLRSHEEGQGTIEYTVLAGVAVIGLVGAFVIADLGTWLAGFLRTAVTAL